MWRRPNFSQQGSYRHTSSMCTVSFQVDPMKSIFQQHNFSFLVLVSNDHTIVYKVCNSMKSKNVDTIIIYSFVVEIARDCGSFQQLLSFVWCECYCDTDGEGWLFRVVVAKGRATKQQLPWGRQDDQYFFVLF